MKEAPGVKEATGVKEAAELKEEAVLEDGAASPKAVPTGSALTASQKVPESVNHCSAEILGKVDVCVDL